MLKERLENIESKLEAWNEDLEYLDSLKFNKKIKNLFKKHKQVLGLLNTYHDRSESRLEKLEEIIQRIYEDDMKAGRKPHKCPVCDGVAINCEIGKIHGLPIKSNKCHACEGKGIVWG